MSSAKDYEEFLLEERARIDAELAQLRSEPEPAKRVPDFSMEAHGEYQGNAYPEPATYTVGLTVLGTGEDFGLTVENSSGGVVTSIILTEEDADGIDKVATTMHGLEVYDDDWKIPAGINRAVFWDLSDGADYLRLEEGQIGEINDWLRYAVGEKTWDWAEQGSKWVL